MIIYLLWLWYYFFNSFKSCSSEYSLFFGKFPQKKSHKNLEGMWEVRTFAPAFGNEAGAAAEAAHLPSGR